MWLLLQKENGKEFIVNEKSIKKIEKISLEKKERVVIKKRWKKGRVIYEDDYIEYNEFWEDEFFGFNIYYDDGKKDTKVSILNVGDLDSFYKEGGYIKEIFISERKP